MSFHRHPTIQHPMPFQMPNLLTTVWSQSYDLPIVKDSFEDQSARMRAEPHAYRSTPPVNCEKSVAMTRRMWKKVVLDVTQWWRANQMPLKYSPLRWRLRKKSRPSESWFECNHAEESRPAARAIVFAMSAWSRLPRLPNLSTELKGAKESKLP